ncbi:MAG: hypothetical protein JRH01_13715 [Deltaproteobacteria bacterium]|nr:hypothetical protein [Deltaproteobacteria bacterium]MBW2394949.1 hypothetical protein [Deltaproteobacteria bacterium]
MQSVLVRTIALVAILGLVAPLGGCAMSRASSRSFASLASIWSLSRSFQSSFGGDERRSGLDEAYAFDVAAAGAAAVGSDAPEEQLPGDVTRVAETHGVTDWESLEETWLGLGIGLRHAGLSEPEAGALVARLFGDERVDAVAAAFDD